MENPIEKINNIANWIGDHSMFDKTIDWEKSIIKHLQKYCIWEKFTNRLLPFVTGDGYYGGIVGFSPFAV